jgi:nitroimidazol reductase NimA-like FMN-containing flavoprotein (pyridoxamine 5'-phosphate oxidase superfamily)
MSIPKKLKVIRNPGRGHYDKETIYRILDRTFLCHTGFIHEGYPVVIPTLFGRDGDTLYLHGSQASRMMKDLEAGADVCITVTNVDGLVLARSAYHHSMNYESVVIFGKAKVVPDADKVRTLKVVSDHLLKGRWEDVRQPNAKELKATMVLSVSLENASAKIRSGDPVDEKEDYSLPHWAGIIPVKTMFGPPESDKKLLKKILPPDYLRVLE